VHQDGLVHVSQLADRYVSDPNQVVAVGQRVKVRVMSVDLQRNRIALTMKAAQGTDSRPNAQSSRPKSPAAGRAPKPQAPPAKPFTPKPGDIAPNGMRFR
jgi:uncharacterized protein